MGTAQALVVATSRAQALALPPPVRGDGGPPMTVEEALAAASAEGGPQNPNNPNPNPHPNPNPDPNPNPYPNQRYLA